MRPSRKLLRFRRLWRTRQGSSWALAALVLGIYAAMVAQQIRAALAEPQPASTALARPSNAAGSADATAGPQVAWPR
jgi:hypothetical protein